MSTVLETRKAVANRKRKQDTNANMRPAITIRSLLRALTLVGFVLLFLVLTQLKRFDPALGTTFIVAQIVLALALFKVWRSPRSN